MRLNYKFLVIIGLSVTLFFGASFDSAKAVYSCGEISRIGNDAIFFGDGPSAEVIRAKNQFVKINVAGEEGCEGKRATFKIYTADQSQEITDVSAILVKGLKTGVSGIYLFSVDWRVNVDNGQYKARLSSVQDVSRGGAGTKFTSNILKVENAQACNLSKAFADPKSIKFGEKTNLTVQVTGQCDNWGISLNIYNETRRKNEPNLPEKKLPTGSHSFVFQWGPTENFYAPSAKGQENLDGYHFVAKLGNQTLQSQQFFVTFTGEGMGSFDNISSGSKLETSFKLTPPEGFPTSIEEFIGNIIDFIFNISIPIAVILIIVSGIIMLTSAGNMARVGKARTILWYTIIGLAIIFIGKGFITLVTSILGGA